MFLIGYPILNLDILYIKTYFQKDSFSVIYLEIAIDKAFENCFHSFFRYLEINVRLMLILTMFLSKSYQKITHVSFKRMF